MGLEEVEEVILLVPNISVFQFETKLGGPAGAFASVNKNKHVPTLSQLPEMPKVVGEDPDWQLGSGVCGVGMVPNNGCDVDLDIVQEVGPTSIPAGPAPKKPSTWKKRARVQAQSS